jgi:hypothetical protein
MKIIGMFFNAASGFWADVIKRPNDFAGFATNANPIIADTDNIPYIVIPSKTWNEFQAFIDSKNLRAEAKEIFGNRIVLPVARTAIKELDWKVSIDSK